MRNWAVTFQARLTAEWLDQRRIVLMFEDRRMQVCTKLGHVVWPQSPWRKGKPEHVREFTMTLSDFNAHWIRGIELAHDAFRDEIAAARVIDPEDVDRKT